MKTVLLTGATGYIGQYTIKPLLEKGFTVHAVSTKPQTSDRENLIWHRADLLSEKETAALTAETKCDFLLHFAWYVEHGKFWNAPENLAWLRASIFLAQKFAEVGGKRIVTAGTCAEYDWTAQNPLVEEVTPRNPRTLYGASKYALDSVLTKFAETQQLSFASGKIFFVFGGKESPNRLVSSVIRNLLDNHEAKTSHGNQIRDFMHVADAAEAFAFLADSTVEGSVNIGSGKGFKINEIVNIIGELTGKSHLLRIGDIPAPPNDPPVITADIDKLKNLVGYRKEFSLRDKLNEVIEYLNHENND